MILSRCRNSMISTLLLISSLLLAFVQAKETEDTAVTNTAVTNLKLGNQTIERVSICLYLSPFISQLLGRTTITAFPAFSAFLYLGLKASFYFRHYNFGHIQYMHHISTRTCKIGELFLDPYGDFKILTDPSDGGILVPMPTSFVYFFINLVILHMPIRTQINTSV